MRINGERAAQSATVDGDLIELGRAQAEIRECAGLRGRDLQGHERPERRTSMKDDKARASHRHTGGLDTQSHPGLAARRARRCQPRRHGRDHGRRAHDDAAKAPRLAAKAAPSRARPRCRSAPSFGQPHSKSAAEALREAKTPTRGHFEAANRRRAWCAAERGKPPSRQRPMRQNAGRSAASPRMARGGSIRTRWWAGWWSSGGPGSARSGPSTKATTPSAAAPASAFPIDFGDNTISSEEQAYIRYNSMDRSFLFVPNLAKTNVVAVNNKKPTGAVKLELMDVITMGRTQLAFVPFCSEEFDWSELAELKE